MEGIAELVCENLTERKRDRSFESHQRQNPPLPHKMVVMRPLTDREYREQAARRLRSSREAAGYSNAELSRLLDVSPTRITSWESGRALPNTPRLWCELCKALGVTADYILYGATSGLPHHMYSRLHCPRE